MLYLLSRLIRENYKHLKVTLLLYLPVSAIIAILPFTGCSNINNIMLSRHNKFCNASWYGEDFDNCMTANGDDFDMDEPLAAHRTLPFGTLVRVTNVRNGRSVVVKIADRGPWIPARAIDLSYAAARKIGMVEDGVAKVKLDIVNDTFLTTHWYGRQYHGQPTASGEIYNMNQLTAAHRSLPFGSIVRVTNLENGNVVTVRINDRIPRSEAAKINLSRQAAEKLGILGNGKARVGLEVIGSQL